jgi:UDP-glucose 4-epimerase
MSGGSRVLITGGAGFIGSHLADALLAAGYRFRALDYLSEQVHGGERGFPDYLHAQVETCRGDVRNRDDVADALAGVDAVFHFACAVGVGQSMYEIEKYTDARRFGAATGWQAQTSPQLGLERLQAWLERSGRMPGVPRSPAACRSARL